MKTIEILKRGVLDRPIAFHRIFGLIAGGTTEGVFLSQLYYWSQRTTLPDGWFYKTFDEWHEETLMTRREVETARKRLVAMGILQEKKEGLPCKLYYRLCHEKLAEAIEKYCGFSVVNETSVVADETSVVADEDVKEVHYQQDESGKRSEPFLDGRQKNVNKGTYRSNSRDPWMVSNSNPNPDFARYVAQNYIKRGTEENKAIANAKAEIRNDYIRAGDLWEAFLEDKKTRELNELEKARHQKLIDNPTESKFSREATLNKSVSDNKTGLVPLDKDKLKELRKEIQARKHGLTKNVQSKIETASFSQQ